MPILHLTRLFRLRNASVSQELAVGFATVIALLLLVSAAALYQQHRSTQAVDRLITKDARLAELVLQSNNLLLKARRYEKDFYLSYELLGFAEAKARYATFFRLQLAEIRVNTTIIRSISDNARIEEQARELDGMLTTYEAGFLTAVDLQSALGHYDRGAAGEVRARARALENRILAHGNHQLNAGQLQMRRKEKDYMLRGMHSDAEQARQASAFLAREIEGAMLSSSERLELLKLNDRYLKSFNDYVRIAGEVQKVKTNYLSAAQQAEPLLHNLHIAATAGVERTRATMLEQASVATRTVIFASMAAALIALVISLLVARRVGRSVRDSMRFAEQIADGNLDSRLEVSAQKEFAVLAVALNTMADALRDSRVTHLSRAEELERSVAERTCQLASANSLLITEVETHRETEAQLQHAKEAAEAATTAKSAFLANMSHEIRTPMNGIIGLTELMMKTSMNPSQRDFMEMIRSSAQALLRLLNDILDFSKMEARKLSLDAIEFDLHDMVGHTMKSFAAQANEKNLELACDIAANMPARLIGDPGRLAQVLVNLVGNAIKFTSRGEVYVHIKLHSIQHGTAMVAFDVRDTGIGIPAEKQKVIFEAFAQADTSTTRQFGGTGLGLAIVLEMIKLMQGSIAVQSESPQGTRFSFIVPLQIAVEQARQLPPAPILEDGAAVLVVDDNRTSRRIVCDTLARWGLRTEQANGGAEAFKMMQRLDPGKTYPLVLIDAGMPGISGFDLVSAMHGMAGETITPIMMLSSADPSDDLGQCARLGIGVSLRKPFMDVELANAVLAALGLATVKTHEPDGGLQHLPTLPPRILKVLVAEDNPVNQRLVLEILKDRGHLVELAENGREVLEKMENETFDAILMDGQMPEMDGYQATVAIREKEKETGTHIRIIAVTAHAMQQDREFCLAAGMDDYLSKPVDAEQLIACLEARTRQPSGDAADAPLSPIRITSGDATPALAVFDLEAAMRRTRGKVTLLREMMRAFQEDLPVSTKLIKQAAQQHDSNTVARGAHRIRGAAGALGAGQLAHAASVIEQLAKTAEYGEMPKAVARFEDCVAALTTELAAQLGEFA